MKTSKPLAELVPDILRHVQEWKPNMEFNFRLYKMLEGQIRKEIEDSLSKELISRAAYNRCVQRIPSLNILERTANKLSKIYIEAPRRKTDDETDQEVLAEIEKESNVDAVLNLANKFYNSLFSFALEPFIEEGLHKVRILAPHQFLVYSDSKTDKAKMTVFIKLLGSRVKNVSTNSQATNDGTRQDTQSRPTIVDIMALYSDTEFMVIDSDGDIRDDIMQEMGITSTLNPFGRIPFVYGKRSLTELIPYPNQPGFDFSVLIPKLLTDLNYAAQFCSHSITWTKNVKLNNQELNPDAIVDLGDSDADGNGDPEIGVITPTVDVSNQLSLIEFQFSAYLDSLGIKAKTNGTLANGRDASGIAKAIDEGDVSSEVKNQANNVFYCIEKELWSLIADMQRVWTSREGVVEKRVFSEDFKKTFSVEFCEIKILKSFAQVVEEVKTLRELKLATRAQAIKLLYPEWSDKQVEAWIKDLDKEVEDNAAALMAGMESMNAETKSNGQFNEGNQQGGKQTPESRPNQVN